MGDGTCCSITMRSSAVVAAAQRSVDNPLASTSRLPDPRATYAARGEKRWPRESAK
jgi:hypothetical protein